MPNWCDNKLEYKGGDSVAASNFMKSDDSEFDFSNILPAPSDISDTSDWDNTTPSEDVFTLGASSINDSASTYIAYLFATLAGISKVGSYTGNGTSQTIDCGFTTGVKFLIVKASSTTGDWIMVDTSRGLDNYLELNTTNAQAAGSGITTDVSGFNVSESTAALNTNAVSYIFYSISN